MYAYYFYWQFVVAPLWLGTFFIHLQRATMHFFSVPLLVQTLGAHWHRDAIPYRGGSLGSYVKAFSLNTISRAIGLCIRSGTLLLWVVAAVVLMLVSVIAIALFISAPFIVIAGLLFGLGLFSV